MQIDIYEAGMTSGFKAEPGGLVEQRLLAKVGI